MGGTAGRAAEVVAEASRRGLTVAVAESLTGGAVCSALVEVPGASRVLRGGVVAYATDLKAQVLGVDADLLAARGAVDGDVAAQMARGVRERLRADVGVATTGVAGPDPQDGAAPGTVFVAVAWAAPQVPPAAPGAPAGSRTSGVSVEVRRFGLPGGRAEVRGATVDAALEMLVWCVARAGAEQGGAAES
ncbi:CinA family protein [Kineococcus sp. NUM-3379]